MSPFKHVDPLVGSAAGALFFTTLSQYYSPRRLELCSEIVCWAILPFFFKYFPSSTLRAEPSLALLKEVKKPHQSFISQWLVAVGVTAAAFYRAESNAIGFYPALTPLLLAVHTYLVSSTSYFDPKSPSSFINTTSGAAIVAVPAVLSLSNGDLFGSLISLISVVSLLVVYSLLTPGFKLRIPSIDIEACIEDMSFRFPGLLMMAIAAQILILGPPTSDIATVLMSASFKAASWFFIIQTANQTSWSMAPIIGTFALASTRNPFSQISQLQAISHILVAILTLFQTTQLLPKQAKGRAALWLFLSVSILPFIYNEYMIHQAQIAAVEAFNDAHPHPVEVLSRQATENFEGLLRNQSKSYEAAVDEYKRRYVMDPPSGFEGWFRFAQQHQSPIIDDFDIVHNSISPFLKLSGQEVIDRMARLHQTRGSEVWSCQFYGKTAKTICRHPHRSYDRHYSLLFNRLLGDLLGELPNVKFLINHFDEPRVMLQPRNADEEFGLTDMSRQATWNVLTRSCPVSQPVVRDPQSEIKTFGLPFVKNQMLESDLCRHHEYKDLQGDFVSPKTFRLIEGLVPVLTTGAFSTMGDILFPSPAYIEDEFQYDETRDMAWSEKKNNVYWRGSTTGGYAQDGRWRDYQRQRFVTLAQNLGQHHHSYLQKQDDSISAVKSTFLNGRLFDVGFTRIFQCDRKFCQDQSTYFNVKSWADKDTALGSKLAFDLDGNGISGRYYKLLSSNSLPLKQTILREWHDERLVPWVHYIPVSQSLEELPELVTFLTSTERGQKLAEGIANRGRDWMGKAVAVANLHGLVGQHRTGHGEEGDDPELHCLE
ncbi:hypothetical protein FIE12Z_1906 [Fusarium flagelliforme]|uniref:Glycosyl transferase CAP10 domain-containing protein n=1 Tax=Fusarium flagelliforme TaxID=2675880 RepID=A0A395N160_9HYPO|nr:hypothetical protein FIE12Z_1906 [Fusarium flagelliforme]